MTNEKEIAINKYDSQYRNLKELSDELQKILQLCNSTPLEKFDDNFVAQQEKTANDLENKCDELIKSLHQAIQDIGETQASNRRVEELNKSQETIKFTKDEISSKLLSKKQEIRPPTGQANPGWGGYGMPNYPYSQWQPAPQNIAQPMPQFGFPSQFMLNPSFIEQMRGYPAAARNSNVNIQQNSSTVQGNEDNASRQNLNENENNKKSASNNESSTGGGSNPTRQSQPQASSNVNYPGWNFNYAQNRNDIQNYPNWQNAFNQNCQNGNLNLQSAQNWQNIQNLPQQFRLQTDSEAPTVPQKISENSNDFYNWIEDLKVYQANGYSEERMVKEIFEKLSKHPETEIIAKTYSRRGATVAGIVQRMKETFDNPKRTLSKNFENLFALVAHAQNDDDYRLLHQQIKTIEVNSQNIIRAHYSAKSNETPSTQAIKAELYDHIMAFVICQNMTSTDRQDFMIELKTPNHELYDPRKMREQFHIKAASQIGMLGIPDMNKLDQPKNSTKKNKMIFNSEKQNQKDGIECQIAHKNEDSAKHLLHKCRFLASDAPIKTKWGKFKEAHPGICPVCLKSEWANCKCFKSCSNKLCAQRKWKHHFFFCPNSGENADEHSDIVSDVNMISSEERKISAFEKRATPINAHLIPWINRWPRGLHNYDLDVHVIGTIELMIKGSDDSWFTIRAAVDPGSKRTLIDRQIVTQLGLQPIDVQNKLQSVLDKKVYKTQEAHIEISNYIRCKIDKYKCLIVDDGFNIRTPNIPIRDPFNDHPHQNLIYADVKWNQPGTIQLIFSVGDYQQMKIKNKLPISIDNLVAESTIYGDVISGSTMKLHNPSSIFKPTMINRVQHDDSDASNVASPISDLPPDGNTSNPDMDERVDIDSQPSAQANTTDYNRVCDRPRAVEVADEYFSNCQQLPGECSESFRDSEYNRAPVTRKLYANAISRHN